MQVAGLTVADHYRQVATVATLRRTSPPSNLAAAQGVIGSHPDHPAAPVATHRAPAALRPPLRAGGRAAPTRARVGPRPLLGPTLNSETAEFLRIHADQTHHNRPESHYFPT